MYIGGGGVARRLKAAESKGPQNGYFKFKKSAINTFQIIDKYRRKSNNCTILEFRNSSVAAIVIARPRSQKNLVTPLTGKSHINLLAGKRRRQQHLYTAVRH